MTILELPKKGIVVKDGKSVYARLPYEFTFTNKEEYLAWRKEWKEMYKSLSQQIREAKHARNNAFRNKDVNAYKHQYEICGLKENATCWLEIRKESKIKAGLLSKS